MSVSVSIITLTKNRSLLLQQCLRSLVGQLSGNDELVLLDNGSTDNTPEVAHAFQQFFTVRYFVSRALGYPKLYNMAVSKSTQKIIVFLDDDCIAGRNFVSHIKRAHKNRVNAYVIQGKTVSIPRGNIYVDIMGDHYANWVSANMMGAKRLRTFDNKNASMPRSVWLRGGGFSEQLSGGSEDIDLGFRLRKEGIQIIYNSSIVAYHH